MEGFKMCDLCPEYYGPGSAPEANVDLIRKTLDLIDTAQGPTKQFDMGDWGGVINPDAEDPELCGTTMCFAGWGVIAAGGKTETRKVGPYWHVEFVVDGENVFAGSFARKAFGLPDDDIFFRMDIKNTDDLREALLEMYGIEV